MLEKYAPTFAAMPPDVSLHLWLILAQKYPGRVARPNGAGTGGPALMEACESAGLYQAEVVMAVADSREPAAVAALELFMGKPLVAPRPEAKTAPGAVCIYPRCKCDVKHMPPGEAAACPQGLAQPTPPAPPTPKAAPAAKIPTRAPTHSDPRPVLEVAPNPRREGTNAHAGYACWRVGDTVDQCLARGLPARYVRKDVGKGRVRLGPVPR